MLDGIPVGNPATIKQDTLTSIDKAQVNKVLDEFAKPLLSKGLDVVVRGYLK